MLGEVGNEDADEYKTIISNISICLSKERRYHLKLNSSILSGVGVTYIDSDRFR